MESGHRAGSRAMERGLMAGQDGLFLSAGHRFREHGERHARVAGFSERSGRVIRTCESGFREEDLGSGESFEDVHGALAERARPGRRLVQRRCLGCWRRLVEQKTAEWQEIFAGAVGQPADVLDQLVYDTDANLTNVQIGEDWKIYRIDFSRAFRLAKDLLSPKDLVQCDRQLFTKLKGLDGNELAVRTKGFLTKQEVQAVMTRRDKILDHFQKLIAEKGENEILY
jgi:hypothetical protein